MVIAAKCFSMIKSTRRIFDDQKHEDDDDGSDEDEKYESE